jgi:ATP-dependent helicase YprA (DUF1998 family)
MRLDPKRVEANARAAATEDLLDRITIHRAGMDAEALPIIEKELRARGVGGEAIRAHEQLRQQAGTMEAGDFAAKCCKCARPAVARVVHWHRLWDLIPVFPRPGYFCAEHLPKRSREPGA